MIAGILPTLRHVAGATYKVPASGGGGGSVSSLADVNTLITNLGGNSGVIGFWDCRLNVTSASLSVSAWGDCRTAPGGGALNTMSLAGTGTAPTIASANQPIVFAASGSQYLATVSNTGLYNAAGPVTMLAVCASAATSDTNGIGGYDATTNAFEIATNATPDYTGVVGSTPTTLTSTVAASTTLRAFILKVNGSGTISLTVSNGTPVTASGVGFGTDTTSRMTLGSTAGSGTVLGNTWAAVALFNFYTNSSQDTTLYNWAVANHAAT